MIMAWRLIRQDVHNIFESMAIDEAIFLHTIKNNTPPTLRFYSTKPAAVSLGYFQDAGREIDLEKCRQDGIDIVRRITGGKAVFHFQEITYCVAAVSGEQIFPKNIAGTYNVISACLACGLSYLGIEAHLADGKRKATDIDFESFCFASPSQNELLVEGKKICGSAQVRSGGAFLQHGSLLIDIDHARAAAVMLVPEAGIAGSTTTLREQLGRAIGADELARVLGGAFEDTLGIKLVDEGLTEAEEELKQQLMAKKYSTYRWNREGKQDTGGKEGGAPADC